MALTRDAVNQLQARILAKEDPPSGFADGVWAMTLGVIDALAKEENAGKGDLQNPHRGMRVRCRDRAIVLQVVAVTRVPQAGQSDRILLEVIVSSDDREKPRGRDFAREDDLGRRYLRLTTFRRWVKGGRILAPAMDREPEPVPVTAEGDPRNAALREVARLVGLGAEDWPLHLDDLVARVRGLRDRSDGRDIS